jgi:hypothetical protein
LLAVLVSLVYLPVTLMTEPDDREHLIRYYVQARPLGFWRPIREEAERRGLLVTEGSVR